MSTTLKLSPSALALLRFRSKQWPIKFDESSRPAYEELVAAGIMMTDGKDFKFTVDGWSRREEVIAAEQDRIERERYEPPDPSDLSEAARELLRACIAGNCPDGNAANRPAYRELVKARLMVPMGSFTKGDECVFRFTYWGWKRRSEFAGLRCAKETGS
jgi:hypothetical protein